MHGGGSPAPWQHRRSPRKWEHCLGYPKALLGTPHSTGCNWQGNSKLSQGASPNQEGHHSTPEGVPKALRTAGVPEVTPEATSKVKGIPKAPWGKPPKAPWREPPKAQALLGGHPKPTLGRIPQCKGTPKPAWREPPKAQVLLGGPQAILKEPPKQVGHPKVTLGVVSSKHRDLLWTHPTVPPHTALSESPRLVPSRSPGDTHMSLAGRFLPSTMRMESALRRAMAGGDTGELTERSR